jgi:hypoxanthine phosphoribosyltransferase
MIRILDRNFELSIPHETIQEKVKELAQQLNKDYEGKNPVMVCILNGAFVFAADLVRHLTFQPEIIFARFSSYDGMVSTGVVKELLGVNANLLARDVIIVEDIVDTGNTLSTLRDIFEHRKSKSVKICSLLDKPDRREVEVDIDYVGFSVPDKFIVGYGLDWDQRYRNLPYIGVVET